MAHTACLFVSLALYLAAAKKEKKAKNALDDVVLVGGTLQNLNNLYFYISMGGTCARGC
jgi:hypothetical protein